MLSATKHLKAHRARPLTPCRLLCTKGKAISRGHLKEIIQAEIVPLNQTLTEQFEAWRERPLLTHYSILYLDGIHFTVRHGTQTDTTIILTAPGGDTEGNKDVLHVSVPSDLVDGRLSASHLCLLVYSLSIHDNPDGVE